MNFIPYNRHILVDMCEEKQEEKNNIIMLPSDYERPKSPYALCTIIDIADDCEIKLKRTEKIVAERRMLHQIDIEGQEFFLVMENYVYGRIHEDRD